MLPQLNMTGTELVDHDEGFTTMRLHLTLPNGAHYFVDEDDWHIGLGQEAVTHAERLNARLTELNADVRVAQLVDPEGALGLMLETTGGAASMAYAFTLVDVAEFRPEDLMTDAERYEYEQMLDARYPEFEYLDDGAEVL